MAHVECKYFPFKDIKSGMRKFAYIPHKANCRIGPNRSYSVWFLNFYFSIKWKWLPEWSPRINTRMDNPSLDTPHIMLRLGTWCGTPGRHQYMLTFNGGASVWVILPTWMSWKNHLHLIRRKLV